MRPTLVGLSGKAGSGKDFLGRQVLRPLGYQQWSLAWHMKHEAIGGIEVNGQIVLPEYADVYDRKPPHVREFLQIRGTELGWMRYGERYWCRVADAWMRTARDAFGFTHFYIPDIRFPHEVDWIHEQGGLVIRLHGRGGLPGLAGQHLSETALDTWDAFDGHLNNSPGRPFELVASELRALLRLPTAAGSLP